MSSRVHAPTQLCTRCSSINWQKHANSFGNSTNYLELLWCRGKFRKLFSFLMIYFLTRKYQMSGHWFDLLNGWCQARKKGKVAFVSFDWLAYMSVLEVIGRVDSERSSLSQLRSNTDLPRPQGKDLICSERRRSNPNLSLHKVASHLLQSDWNFSWLWQQQHTQSRNQSCC